MAVTKKITIDGQEVGFKASAAVQRLRQCWKRQKQRHRERVIIPLVMMFSERRNEYDRIAHSSPSCQISEKTEGQEVINYNTTLDLKLKLS